jgi:hypothetical protein
MVGIFCQFNTHYLLLFIALASVTMEIVKLRLEFGTTIFDDSKRDDTDNAESFFRL